MKYDNKRGASFLLKLDECRLKAKSSDLTKRCKFNFSYFTVANGSQDFCDWEPEQLHKLLNALKDYSVESLHHWQKQKMGKGSVLSVYGDFPKNSAFKHPQSVPTDVIWGRFRLQSAVRLCGFMVPREFHGESHVSSGEAFDSNTFYVVFLDREHSFYQIEPK
ncbi:hypothetical protein [Luteibacter sp.]|jgi:hypothetical protein|uniref:hypothetical protein n=1 Tax=Luteibacter sp. TaxID=1886636 RepID=UPI003F7DE6CC